jgi:hypothetical protein
LGVDRLADGRSVEASGRRRCQKATLEAKERLK